MVNILLNISHVPKPPNPGNHAAPIRRSGRCNIRSTRAAEGEGGPRQRGSGHQAQEGLQAIAGRGGCGDRNSREPELKKLKGLRHIMGLASKDDEYLVIALYESEAHAEDETTLTFVGDFWFRMSAFIEGPPDVHRYDVSHFQTYSST